MLFGHIKNSLMYDIFLIKKNSYKFLKVKELEQKIQNGTGCSLSSAIAEELHVKNSK